MPVTGFLTAHFGDAFSYCLQTVQALERLDGAEEQFSMGAER
jgi:hypothetical protein